MSLKSREREKKKKKKKKERILSVSCFGSYLLQVAIGESSLVSLFAIKILSEYVIKQLKIVANNYSLIVMIYTQ